MLWVILILYNITAFFMWALVHGAAKCRSPEDIRALDEEQARILSEMMKSDR